jgi:hypothetical protein
MQNFKMMKKNKKETMKKKWKTLTLKTWKRYWVRIMMTAMRRWMTTKSRASQALMMMKRWSLKTLKVKKLRILMLKCRNRIRNLLVKKLYVLKSIRKKKSGQKKLWWDQAKVQTHSLLMTSNVCSLLTQISPIYGFSIWLLCWIS